MKKEWAEPRIMVQQFMANEYVAACWKVGCENSTTKKNQSTNAPDGSLWGVEEGPYDDAFSHQGSCRTPENNYFQANGKNVIFEFEKNSEQGNLGGGFDFWVDKNGNDIIDTGDVIYWHTSNSVRTWNHWGYVESVDADHINRS